MNNTSAVEVICHAFAPGPGLGVNVLALSSYEPSFELTLFVPSATRAVLLTYASRSMIRCSRLGSARFGAAGVAAPAAGAALVVASAALTANGSNVVADKRAMESSNFFILVFVLVVG